MTVIANVFPKLQTVKNFVRPPCKKRRLGTHFEHNIWKCPEYFKNLHESMFMMCFYPFGRSWFRKCLPYCYLKSYLCLLT